MKDELNHTTFKEHGFPTIKIYPNHFEIIDIKNERMESFRYDEVHRIRYDSRNHHRYWFLDVVTQVALTAFKPYELIIISKSKIERSFEIRTLTNERLTAILREIGDRCRKANT